MCMQMLCSFVVFIIGCTRASKTHRDQMSVIFLHSAEGGRGEGGGAEPKALWEILIAQIHLGSTSC